MHILKKKSPYAFLSIFVHETPLFSLNLHLKILYLFPYFRTKRPALFVIYPDKNISSERRFNELSIDVSFLIFGKKIIILRSGETNHLRSERRRENYTMFCTLKMGV